VTHLLKSAGEQRIQEAADELDGLQTHPARNTGLIWYRERQDCEYAALEMEPQQHVYRALDYWTIAGAG